MLDAASTTLGLGDKVDLADEFRYLSTARLDFDSLLIEFLNVFKEQADMHLQHF
jgi:hypothetical protein